MAQMSQPLRATTIDFPQLKHRSKKEEAFAQLKEHKIPEKLEEVLNKACRLKPDDLYGYMSDYFRSLSKEPVISSLSVYEGLDANGGRSVEVEVYCTVCGVDKLVGKSSISVDPLTSVAEAITASSTSTPRKGSAKKKGSSRGGSPAGATTGTSHADESKVSLAGTGRKMDFMETVKKEISKHLIGLPVGKQREIDQVLEKWRLEAVSHSDKDKVILHPSSLLAVSCAVAKSGSHLASHPLFLFLSSVRTHFEPASPLGPLQIGPCSLIVDLYDGKENGVQHLEVDTHFEPPSSPRRGSISAPQFPPSRAAQKYTVPFPVVAVMGQGAGKLKFKEFCVCPLPDTGASLSQQMRMLERIHYELGKCLAAKMGASARLPLPNGAYSPSLDKLEQALDLLKEATVNGGFQLSTDVAILIDVEANALYDSDKGKYEIMSGHWKSTDELISMFSDLLAHSSTGVLGFIDPLHHKDVAGWKKLLDKLASKCLIIADSSLRKGLPLVQRKVQSGGRRSSSQEEGGDIKTEGEREVEKSEDVEDEGVEGLSCAALTWENTLSSTIDKADQLKGCCQYLMMTVPLNLTVNTTIADLAVAAHCQFIRLGAPTGVSTLLLNRLLHILEELHSRKLYESVHTLVSASDAQQ